MSYVKRQIDVTCDLGLGPDGTDGFESVKMHGLRVSASIEILGMPSMNKATLQVYGMTLDLMNKFSRAGVLPLALRKNAVQVNAGDAENGMALVYGGIIGHAFQDLQAAPEVSFNIYAWTNQFAAVNPVAANSYPATGDVATIMRRLATQMGYDFESNGVSVQLANPYLFGTARMQMQSVANAAHIYAFIENEKTLVILDQNKARGGTIPLIDVHHGMVGYPKLMNAGWISVRTIFNPTVKFLGQINVQSGIKPMSGIWRVRKITHSLESETPNGAWYTDIDASMFGADRA